MSLLIIFIVQQQSFIIFLYPFSIRSFAGLLRFHFNLKTQQQSKNLKPTKSSFFASKSISYTLSHPHRRTFDTKSWIHFLISRVLFCCAFVFRMIMTGIEANTVESLRFDQTSPALVSSWACQIPMMTIFFLVLFSKISQTEIFTFVRFDRTEDEVFSRLFYMHLLFDHKNSDGIFMKGVSLNSP